MTFIWAGDICCCCPSIASVLTELCLLYWDSPGTLVIHSLHDLECRRDGFRAFVPQTSNLEFWQGLTALQVCT